MKTPRLDSLYPPDWLRFAERDWERIGNRLSEDDPDPEDAGLQQALEKYLKAFLLANGWKLEKTHELSTLLQKAQKYNSALGNFMDICERVENYYFVERYPLSLDTGILFEEVEKDYKEAHPLRDMLLAALAQKPNAAADERKQAGMNDQQASPNGENKSIS